MDKPNILDLSYEELLSYISSIGEKPFRATQISESIYQKNVFHFNEIKNLPASVKQHLEKDFICEVPVCLCEQVSKDGTRKMLFELKDKEQIETVIIPTENRATICVSTQAGCKHGCRFCASGLGGFKRNLTCAEIVGQILHVRRLSAHQALSHIVFMGVGEPLDNYDNLLKAIRIINASKGFNVGARRITISTCGLISSIKRLVDENLQVELSISLHASNDVVRNQLMPINQKYSLHPLIKACQDYVKKTNRQITFEYILIKDMTCTLAAAKELQLLFKGLLCKMNLILYNEVKELPYKSPTQEEINSFQRALERFNVHATFRRPRGRDIAAACGQLRHKHQEK